MCVKAGHTVNPFLYTASKILAEAENLYRRRQKN